MAVLEDRLHSIKCQDRLEGAYGIRGNLEDTEFVVLQGVGEEWFAMAFKDIEDQANPSLVKSEQLESILAGLEDAFGN